MSQKPSLGRIVLVTVDPHGNNGSDVAPAVIVRAWSDEMVNVRVLRDGPDVAWMTSIPLFQTREDLDAEREKRAAQLVETNPHAMALTFHGAYWPPRM